jgi:hypothetical protein
MHLLKYNNNNNKERIYIAKIDEGPNIVASYITVIQVLPKVCDRTKPSNLYSRASCEMPPKRVTRTIKKPKDSDTLSGVQESVKLTESLLDETIEQELAVLRAQVVKENKLIKLKTLRKRLAGEIFTSRSDKYKSVSSLSGKPRKRLRVKTPPIFIEKSLRELHEYDTA